MRSLTNLLPIVAAVLLSLCLSSVTKAATAYTSDPIDRIEAAYQDGEIDLDQKVVLQVTAITKPQSLPTKFQLTVPDGAVLDSRGPSMVIKEIRESWDLLLPSTQNFVSEQLARPETEFVFASPSGFFRLLRHGRNRCGQR